MRQDTPHRRHLAALALAALALLAACGDEPALMGSESYQTFTREVAPVLEARCGAGCHGVDAGNHAAYMKDPLHAAGFHFPIDPVTGRIPRQREALLAAFDISVKPGRIDYAEAPRFSPLLRAPLAQEYGGLPHRGLDVFFTPDDPDYRALERWVGLEIARRPQTPPQLPGHIAHFRDQVQGVLLRNGCFLANCHGPAAFNDLKLQPPLPASDGGDIAGGFSRAMTLENRAALLGRVTRFANLGGDLRRSRLIVKNLPIAEGGIHQRGGNDQFFESFSDRDVQILLDWLGQERKALAQHLTSDGRAIDEADLGRLRGILFIRGPRHAPRRFFDLDAYWPGSDIFLLPLAPDGSAGEPVNLTAAFHPDAPVEIQSFDLRYDGRAVVFAMRRGAQEGFRLYELRVDERGGAGETRQLSFAPPRQDGGDLIHHIDPVYIPGPGDPEGHALDTVAVAYASNEAGNYAQALPWGLPGEADGGSGVELHDRQRSERPGSLDGRRVTFVAGPHRGQWRVIRAHRGLPDGGARLVLDRPLPQPPDRRTVYVIEQPVSEVVPAYDIWRLVPSGGDARAGFERSARRMTWSGAQERRPTVRTSGEVMFTSVRNTGYQNERPVYNGAIFRVQAGGFDYHIHGGNRSRHALYADSRETAEGLEVRLALDPRNHWGGAPVLADHGLGINAEPENPVDGLAYAGDGGDAIAFSVAPRYLPSLIPLFPEQGDRGVTATGLSPGGAFRDPYPLPDGSLLLAHAAGPLDQLDPAADPDWDLYRLRFPGSPQSADGRRAGALTLERIAAAASELADYHPRPLMVRLKERAETHQKFIPGFDEARLRDDYGVRRAPDATPAVVECFDYPLLQSFLTDFTPAGPRGLDEADRLFRYVRIVAQLPARKEDLVPLRGAADPFATRLSSGVHGRRVIVAEVPLEADGSFYAEVPPNTPLIVQGLDAQRRAVHAMNRWFYLQPGERLTFSIPRGLFPHVCAGCHGSLTGDPAEALGPPDLVTASSRVMANWDPLARARRKPHGAGKTFADYRDIDFRRDVQPILDRACVSCHAGDKAAAGLDLAATPTRHYSVAYESLHRLRDPRSADFAGKRHLDERAALSSRSALIDKLADGHPAPLPQDDLLTLIRWIDLGATFIGGRS